MNQIFLYLINTLLIFLCIFTRIFVTSFIFISEKAISIYDLLEQILGCYIHFFD